MRSNKEMKLTGAEPIARPQLISGVRPTHGSAFVGTRAAQTNRCANGSCAWPESAGFLTGLGCQGRSDGDDK
jgi:hypothetical protein